MQPPFVVHESDVAASEGRYPHPFDAEGLGLGRDLGRAAGTHRLGAWVDRLLPGRRTSRPHAHLREEELVYVLEGAPVLRWWPSEQPRQEVPLRAGHFVALPAGTGIAHCFFNPGPEEARLLVVGERRPSDRVAFPQDPDLESWRTTAGSMKRWPDLRGPTGEGRPPPFRIETARVVLEPVRPRDVLDQIDVIRRNHDHLRPWMGWARRVPTIDLQLAWAIDMHRQFLAGEDYPYVVRRPSGELIGGTGLHRRSLPGTLELAYWIAADAQGQGLVTEWAAALCRVGTELLGARRITLHHDVDNHRSRAVAERLGFTHEGRLRHVTLGEHGQPVDAMLWSWLPSDATPQIGQAAVRAWDGAGRRLL